MRLQKVLNILGQMPKKSQKVVLSVVDFDRYSPSENYKKIIETMITVAKSANQRELLEAYADMQPTDEEVLEAFHGKGNDSLTPLYFNEEQIEFIANNVYRNRDGDFRLIPHLKNCSAEAMPLEGLKADDDIISARLQLTRIAPNGSSEEFDGLKELRKQPYEGPYDGVFLKLAPNLRRINIISSFASEDPHGFFTRDGQMYRNVCSQMTRVNEKLVTEQGFRRAMFLMFLVSGGRAKDWEALYNLVHFMVRVPNSATGYVLYLNDFDAGGNGKSKFIGLLHRMFGDSFTAFSTQQLRFTISLMGKRLVSISEYEDSDTAKQLQALIKSMTGRDNFQYEGKGVDPIVAETYQNFVISSNKYIYFDDSGIKRRLQNFHCSNLLHLMMNRFTKNQDYLNSLFGNIYNGEALLVQNEMAHSLLDFIHKDDRSYSIPIRPQSVVLGSLKNPILRALFNPKINFKGFCTPTDAGTRIDLIRLFPEAKPEQFNYASQTIQNWFSELQLSASRDNISLMTSEDFDKATEVMQQRLSELDERSNQLKSKEHVRFEKCEVCGFNSYELFQEFLLPECIKYNIPVTEIDNFIKVG
jgi:hypothetical protein